MYLKVETTDAAKQLSELLKDGDWMVLYYAEWCGHCNAMKPEWEKVVEKLKETGKINVADVKSDFIDSLLHKPKIEGFPTIKMYNKGREVAKFEDERSAAKIEKFAMSNSTNTKTHSKTEPQHITANKNIINLEELSSEPITKPTTTKRLESSSVPQVLGKNTNDVRKLSISQLKDEIFKSNRQSKNASRIKANSNELINTPRASGKVKMNTNISNLDMLLHPPMPSIKASKKPTIVKPKLKTHIQRFPNNRKSNKTFGTFSPIPTLAQTSIETPMYSNLACSDIRKAKICKNNPKCFYDYIEFKCKDKSEKTAPKPRLNNLAKDKNSKPSKRILDHKLPHNPRLSQKQNQKQSGKQSEKQRNNKNNANKELLETLRKSFNKISNEPKKDSNLLEKESELI